MIKPFLLLQVHPQLGITKQGMTVMNDMVCNAFHTIAEEGCKLSKMGDRSTLQARDVGVDALHVGVEAPCRRCVADLRCRSWRMRCRLWKVDTLQEDVGQGCVAGGALLARDVDAVAGTGGRRVGPCWRGM